MITVFRFSLARLRGQIFGWGIALAMLGAVMMWVYPAVAEQQEVLQQLVEAYPPELMAFFGGDDFMNYATPEGYLSIEYFSYMPLVLGIFAVLAGSGLLASDEEKGVLDLVMAHPVSRTQLFVARTLALLAATGAILGIGWLGLVLPAAWTSFEIGWLELVRPFASMGAQILLFASLALLLSMLLPSRRLAAMTSGILLVASYFISGLSRINEDLETIAKFSPLTYYQTGDVFDNLNGQWLAGLLAAAAIFTILAWWRFERRDIRVAGEGGWGFAVSWRRPAAAPKPR